MTNTTNLVVADTILAQLGGARFLAMTGAKHLMGDATSLTFKLPRGARKGINCIKIELTIGDEYTVTFFKLSRSYEATVISIVEGITTDMLQPLFTMATGLATSLGICSAVSS